MGHFVQVKTFLKILLNPIFKMQFFKILNIKRKIIIILIIIQKNITFHIGKKIVATFFFNKEP
jgi:hypothetical protein